MGDCDNVEIRELLPEHAAGALDAGTRARVDTHLAGCAVCRAELALLTAVRGMMHRQATIDVARVSRGVVGATAVRSARRQRGIVPATHWPAIRVAASIALAAAGVATFGVWQQRRGVGAGPDTLAVVTTPATPARAAGLAPAGGLAELDDDQLNTLLNEIGAFEAAPVEDPAEIVPTFADPSAEEIQ